MDDARKEQYAKLRGSVVEQIRLSCKRANQTLLLFDLLKHRKCDPLLVAESNEDVWAQENVVFTSSPPLSFGQPGKKKRDESSKVAIFYSKFQ